MLCALELKCFLSLSLSLFVTLVMDFLEYSINLSFPSSLLSLHLSPFQTYLKCIRTWLIYQISKYSSWLLSPFPFNFLLFFFFFLEFVTLSYILSLFSFNLDCFFSFSFYPFFFLSKRGISKTFVVEWM